MRSIRCRLGRHTGQAEGGTMMFTCPRCKESFWQTKDMSHITAEADRRLALGDHTAVDWAREQIKSEVNGDA